MIDPTERALARVHHVKDAITVLRGALQGRAYSDVRKDRIVWAGLQRCLEIVSEASRHIPEQWKLEFGPSVPWRSIGDIGNHLRHAYHRTDDAILWQVYTHDLDPLEAAVDAMIAAYPPNPPPPAMS